MVSPGLQMTNHLWQRWDLGLISRHTQQFFLIFVGAF